MILIADSGSTKTDWCIVKDGTVISRIGTKGINPFFQSEEEISKEIETTLLPQLPTIEFDAIHFYGAGCLPEKTVIVQRVLASHLNVKNGIKVNSDMLGAARACCGKQPGIVCIMGTGSNSCFYDGEKIVSNVSPLGFILGDEGSGAVLGKLLAGDVLKNQLSPELKEAFMKEIGITVPEIIDRIYRQPFPNRFLAGLSPFLARHINEPSIHALVLGSFKAFLRRNVMQYDYQHHTVHFIGSIAHYYKEVLLEAAQESGIQIGAISKSPMEGLIQSFVEIWSEAPSLYNDLEKKSICEILEDINTEDQKVAPAVRKAIPQIEKLVSRIVPLMEQGGRIFYMGAGTSGRLGVLDASEIPPTFGIPPACIIGLIAGGDSALRNPVENAEDDSSRGWEELLNHHITDKDTVIGVAASGTTPYVTGALREARAHGILTGCITSNPNSPIVAEADIPIEIIVGPEYITGSSRMKSGTGQKMILNMISTAVMIRLGRVKDNKMVNMQLSNQKLIDRGTRMIVEELELDYERAKVLLLMHGSVKKAIDNYKNNKPQ